MTPISEHRLHELLARFAGKRVLVAGDIALDEYIWGKMTGISPEGPVPVVYVHDRTLAPGAAANTAAGLAELGAIVTLCGCVGDDPNGKTLTQHLEQKGVDTSAVIAVEGATTSTNTKINAGGDHSAPHEVLRTHTAPQGDVGAETQEAVIGSIQQRAEEVDAIILADQAGSVVTRRVIDYVIGLRQEHGML
ncbi:MAG: hypothetical protein HQ592_15885, partial [Planctomycetes bacterium]|nr:hypothetical protein [Planctomycetota bacterium]